MHHSRPLLALGATGLTLATLLTAIPASAAPVDNPSSTAESSHGFLSDSSSSDKITIQRDLKSVTLVVKATPGTVVTARDRTAGLAGAPVLDGIAMIMVGAPVHATTVTIEETGAGATTRVGEVTLDGSLAGDLSAPDVSRVLTADNRAAATVSGEAGAVVIVTDMARTVVGMKLIGPTGTTSVPLAASVGRDDTLLAAQRIGTDISDATQIEIASPAKVDVGFIGSDAAVVAFTGVLGTNWSLKVLDSSGNVVARGHFDPSGPTSRVLPVTPGKLNQFTVIRGDDGLPWSSKKTFEVDARSSVPMTDPAVRFVSGMTRIDGIPAATIRFEQADGAGLPVVDAVATSGAWLDIRRRLKPSTIYTVTQSVGSDSSATVRFTTPAR